MLERIIAIIPEQVWNAAIQSGFNAVLVLILMTYIYLKGKEDRVEREKDRRSWDLLTRSVTDLLLAAHFVPPPMKEAAKERQRELDDTK